MKYIFMLIAIIGIAIFFSIKNDTKTPDLNTKIAQMLMIGFNEENLTQENPIYHDVKNLKIGGVILFNKNVSKTQPELQKNINNPKQLKKLTTDLQNITEVPLFISIDQEGGLVSRLNQNFEVSRYSAKELGYTNDLKFTFSEALKTAETLQKLGVNVNFAPCVDVEVNPLSAITKAQRIFSPDVSLVTAHASEVVKAHQKASILPVLKHFPGHGSALGDTHFGFVDATDEFTENELKPYKTIIKNYPDIGVMTTHVFNKNIDKLLPLSLSEKSITDILKKNIGFTGLVFSDDLNMGALTKFFTLDEILIKAIQAGTDVLVIGNNLQYNPDIASEAISIIRKAVENGEISEERINNSYNKIMRIKANMLKHNI